MALLPRLPKRKPFLPSSHPGKSIVLCLAPLFLFLHTLYIRKFYTLYLKIYSKSNTLSLAATLFLTGFPASAFVSYLRSSSGLILNMQDTLILLTRHSDCVSPLLQNYSGLRVRAKSLLWPMWAHVIYLTLTSLTLPPVNHATTPSTSFLIYSRHASTSGPLHLFFPLPGKLFLQISTRFPHQLLWVFTS